MSSCCKDCIDRKIGCHSNCSRYAEYKKELDKIKEIKSKEIYIEHKLKNRKYIGKTMFI